MQVSTEIGLMSSACSS